MSKDLEYYRKNAEEDYATTPTSVLRYIAYLELSKLEDEAYGYEEYEDIELDSLEGEDDDE